MGKTDDGGDAAADTPRRQVIMNCLLIVCFFFVVTSEQNYERLLHVYRLDVANVRCIIISGVAVM